MPRGSPCRVVRAHRDDSTRGTLPPTKEQDRREITAASTAASTRDHYRPARGERHHPARPAVPQVPGRRLQTRPETTSQKLNPPTAAAAQSSPPAAHGEDRHIRRPIPRPRGADARVAATSEESAATVPALVEGPTIYCSHHQLRKPNRVVSGGVFVDRHGQVVVGGGVQVMVALTATGPSGSK